MKRIKESKEKQKAYKDNLKQLRDMEHQAVVEKSKKKQMQIMKNLSLVKKAKKERRINSETNFRKKFEMNEANKKRIEEEHNLNILKKNDIHFKLCKGKKFISNFYI